MTVDAGMSQASGVPKTRLHNHTTTRDLATTDEQTEMTA